MKGNSSGCRKKDRSSYKYWALFGVLVLGLWSMVSESVKLKRTGISDGLDLEDVDILEVEEREKVVRHMWDLYGRSRCAKLSRFWRNAFDAAYENLVSDVHGVRDSAFSDIAKISVALHPLPQQHNSQEGPEQSRKMGKHGENKKED